MVGEVAAAVVLVLWWFAAEGDSLDTSVPIRTETFIGSPYAALAVVGIGAVLALARSRAWIAVALLGVVLVSQLLFWPARLSQTGWTAYLILLPVPYLLAFSSRSRHRQYLLALVVAGATTVAALLTLPSLSMSGVWGTINGKPWDSPSLWPDVIVWLVLCLGAALGMWALGSRAARPSGEGAPQAGSGTEAAAGVPAGSPAGLNLLSTREREIYGLVAQGLTNAEIAKRAFIAETTVKSHVSSILRKMGAGSRSELIASAHANGLVGDVVGCRGQAPRNYLDN